MKDQAKSLEELADDILEKDAKKRGTTLYREGIIDERRRRVHRQREFPMSALEKNQKED